MWVSFKKISASYTPAEDVKNRMNPNLTQTSLLYFRLNITGAPNSSWWPVTSILRIRTFGGNLWPLSRTYLTQFSSSYSCLHMLTSATPAPITWMIIPTSRLFFFICLHAATAIVCWDLTTAKNIGDLLLLLLLLLLVTLSLNTMQTQTEGLKLLLLLLLLLLLVHSLCGCCVRRRQL